MKKKILVIIAAIAILLGVSITIGTTSTSRIPIGGANTAYIPVGGTSVDTVAYVLDENATIESIPVGGT